MQVLARVQTRIAMRQGPRVRTSSDQSSWDA